MVEDRKQSVPAPCGVLFDLDQTLIDSSIAAEFRKQRNWSQVYPLISAFVPYEGVTELLRMLVNRRVPVGIVTSSPSTYCARVIEHHQIPVSNTTCFHDTTDHKPHPAPILKGIEKLGVVATEVWVIGDDTKDVQAAVAAGAHAIAATWGAAEPDTLRAAGAEQMFDTVAELHAFLDRLTRLTPVATSART